MTDEPPLHMDPASATWAVRLDCGKHLRRVERAELASLREHSRDASDTRCAICNPAVDDPMSAFRLASFGHCDDA